MPKVTTISELRLFQGQNRMNRSWGLVPTMGSLHEGHLKLIAQAVEENRVTFVTIFVNPTQFDNKVDLDNYPSSIETDLQKIQAIDPKICVFVPSVKTIYPDGATVKKYALQGLDKPMEGRHRPGHFDGVATVVERLFALIQPDVAYFGQKDFQHLQIVSLLAQSMKIRICSLPTVREQNGLAMSSRNRHLSPKRREEAKLIYELLQWTKSNFSSISIADLKEGVVQKLFKTPDFQLDYFEIAAEHNLCTASYKKEGVSYRAFIAVVVDGIRLIDNMSLN
jgi:pantoate--beta-alanine ligase